MKFRFISAHRETFNVGRMCSLFNVSRSGYYACFKRPESRRSRENRILEDKIRVYHAASHGPMGLTEKMWQWQMLGEFKKSLYLYPV